MKIIVVIFCCLVSTFSGHHAFSLAKEGFLQIGLNAVSAENFARIIWIIVTSVSLTAIITLNKYILEEDESQRP
jgi:hypothetical protein